jgi:hypothetical protein
MATARKRTVIVNMEYDPNPERPEPMGLERQFRELVETLPGHRQVAVDVGFFEDFDVPEPVVVNKPALVKVVAWVAGEHAKKDLPSEWDQDWWYRRKVDDGTDVDTAPNWCGTAACVAGKVAIMAGGIPEIGTSAGEVSDHVIMPDGSRQTARTVAMRELGLNERQADVLFSGANNYDDIMSIAKQILDGEVHPVSRHYLY